MKVIGSVEEKLISDIRKFGGNAHNISIGKPFYIRNKIPCLIK